MVTDPETKKRLLGEVFSRTATSYGRIRYFDVFGRWLVEHAQLAVGARVLDVATGRGAVLFPAADQVGSGGSVVGIDLASGMAAETDAEVKRRGIKNASCQQMDAEALTFPDAHFDALLCGFSLQFFPDLARALAEFVRVMKPGGRLGVSTWGDDDPAWDWFDDLRKAYGAALKLSTNSLDEPENISAALSKAGFEQVEVNKRLLDEVYGDEEEWWNVECSISGREGLDRLSPDRLSQLKAEAFDRMQAHRTAAGFPYRLQAFISTARKPM